MALTRKFLAALGIEDAKVDEIIQAHTDTVNGLKEEIEKYKGDAEKLPGVKQELDALKADREKEGKDPFKVKYEAIKEEFDKYKKRQFISEIGTFCAVFSSELKFFIQLNLSQLFRFS